MAGYSVRIFSLFLVFFLIGSISHASSEAQSEAQAEVGVETEKSSESQSPEFVVTLDNSNFTDFVSRQKFIIVEFYAPWCGHCKNLAPEYEKAASILSKEDPPLLLAKVDADNENNRPLAAEFGVQSYPTIKILRYGGSFSQEYKGPRDADGIVEYVKKQSGPASSLVQSPENVTSQLDVKKVVIVGIFPEFSGDKFENFTTLAERLRADYEFRHTSDPKLLPGGDLSVSGPLLRLFKHFDELVMDFEEFDTDALQKLVEEASTPSVTVFDKDPNNHPYVMKYFSSSTSKAMLFVDFSSETFDAYKSKYEDVANQFKGKDISFLMGDVEVGTGAFQYFGLKNEQTPLIFVLDDPAKYLKTNVEPDQILAWLNEFKDGKLQKYQKSEPIPEVNNEPVKVVVADSLGDMVFKSGKNVLLEFYAPWCGHCKKLAPILDEVAVSFENDADVVITKMDATANDVPEEFDVQGYPTLYFKSASGKLVQYEGDRTKEDIIEFIQNNKDSATQQKSDKDSATQQESNKESATQEESTKDEL